MADVARVEAAPAGTQRKSAADETWVEANAGDLLAEGDEIKNVLGSPYSLSIYPGDYIRFTDAAGLELLNASGTVMYYSLSGAWVAVNGDGTYTAQAVGVGEGSGVMIVCARKGVMKIGPFPAVP